MAFDNKTVKPKAAAFLNLSLRAADGSEVKIRKGIALETENLVERSLINAAKADPEREFVLCGTVHMVEDASSKEDVLFA